MRGEGPPLLPDAEPHHGLEGAWVLWFRGWGPDVYTYVYVSVYDYVYVYAYMYVYADVSVCLYAYV